MPIKPMTGTLWTVLVGAVLGAGAALLLPSARERVKASLKAATRGPQKGGTDGNRSEGPYCAVPEGADICFPEK